MAQSTQRSSNERLTADRTECSDEIQILYVEDDPAFADLSVTCLKDESTQFSITTASNPATALERVSNAIDCIVSDYNMPGMNGIEFLERVRETHPDIPFILFTGRGSEEIASEAISAGVTDYLQKDGGTDQFIILANRITNAVDQRRTEAALGRQCERLDTVANNAPLILFAVNSQGILTLLEGQGLTKLELAPDEVIGQSVFETFANNDDITHAAERALNGEQVTMEQQIGGAVWETAYNPVLDADGTVQTVIGVAIDITDRKERQQALEAERERFQKLFKQLSQPVVELAYDDSDPIIKQANTAFENTFGYTTTEIIGESLDDLIVPDDKQREAESINDHVETTGCLEPMEVRRQTAEGTREFLLQNAVYDDGERAFAIYTDITEQKKRRRELEILRTAVDKAHVPVVLTDPQQEDNPMVYVNDAFEATTGYSKAEATGRNCRFLQGEETDPERVAELRAAIAEEKPATVTLRNYTKDGTMFWNRVKLRPIYDTDGNVVRYFGSQEDVTERKESRERLERQNERLSEFAGVIAHDLRSPLTVAGSRLELVADEYNSEHLDAAMDAVDRSHTLIDDLLALARDGVKVGDTARVDLAAATKSCWEIIDTADATLSVETGASISADYTRLQQLLENLIRNAVDHGGDDVHITVGSLTDQSGFYIADDGPGVPPNDRDLIFESGYSSNAQGTGFGLAITQAIVHDHGWDIAVTTSQAGGARFEISSVEQA
jgi:PAS domain S-box-containing protein